ncbi:hypothetical protein SLEP1_g11213 [Rubroshorea leprosula]|uniref:Uncharacterized protein n=1 Tax=Rubroshorea leprosula TaxID=152421 RepID=A0AAV5IIJ8_9ROSI|nr:hypothetical protein SLEP1_g11213 [Rubroshorea leprosula]
MPKPLRSSSPHAPSAFSLSPSSPGSSSMQAQFSPDPSTSASFSSNRQPFLKKEAGGFSLAAEEVFCWVVLVLTAEERKNFLLKGGSVFVCIRRLTEGLFAVSASV